MPRCGTTSRCKNRVVRAKRSAIRIRNSDSAYGLVHVTLHWLIAVSVIGLLASGLWMTGLGYAHPWYHRAPELHKAFGVLVGAAMLARLGWRLSQGVPRTLPTIPAWEARSAHLAHMVLYLGVFAAVATGYLMSTAEGDGVSVFGFFSVPATLTGEGPQADLAGLIHLWIGYGLIALASIHALAALKHHLFDRDATLLRMLGIARDPLHTPHKQGATK